MPKHIQYQLKIIMKIKEQDVKEVIEFRKSYDDLHLEEAIKDWDGVSSIFEQGVYYPVEQFNVYASGIRAYLDGELDYDTFNNWLNVVRGALSSSAFNQGEKGIEIHYIKLILLLSQNSDDVSLDKMKIQYQKALDYIYSLIQIN